MRVRVGVIIALLLMITVGKVIQSPTYVAQAQPQTPDQTTVPQGFARIQEQEINDDPFDANVLSGSNTVVRGSITQHDIDYFKIDLTAGQRLALATITRASIASGDTTLSLFASTGNNLDPTLTLIETDLSDGVHTNGSSVISSQVITTTGSYYIRVQGGTVTTVIQPYDLYVRVLSTSVSEQEPNDQVPQAITTQASISGVLSTSNDLDRYQFNLNAGDTIFTTLDFDPERDGITWNGFLQFSWDDATFEANDANAVSPNAEANVMTVKHAGSYEIVIGSYVAVGPQASYLAQVLIIPAITQANCQTVTSQQSQAIGPNRSVMQSSITVAQAANIADIDVLLDLNHSLMSELDVTLTAPDGNVVALFTDIGSAQRRNVDLVIDQQAALPLGTYNNLNGVHFAPEYNFSLDWFAGQQAQGQWTLTIYDTADSNGGTLNSWGLRICGMPAPADCPTGKARSVIYSSQFEADNGGFSAGDDDFSWVWGNRNGPPIGGNYSGANSWNTNLTGNYPNSSRMELYSPNIDLTNVSGPIYASWYQRYQLDNSLNDFYVVSKIVPFSNVTPLFEHRSVEMRTQVNTPTQTLEQSTGWSLQRHDISSDAGSSLRLKWDFGSDSAANFAGISVDDVEITGCIDAGLITPTITPTASVTPTPSATPIVTPSITPTPSASPTIDPARFYIHLPFVVVVN
ncbi:proprotein convertase P-domain-containing protein [Herpetosiphon llansteffanensis]|uniref:proprotein convertase P-domain-containing protein n=1 Tax=Herpetosiphon llansteffanensis TaxID=2094568 RepID=UPI000D7C091E|nr:proprotein convertase P-domain-containing protein [Herpetosiphon llansteffanensis]